MSTARDSVSNSNVIWSIDMLIKIALLIPYAFFKFLGEPLLVFIYEQRLRPLGSRLCRNIPFFGVLIGVLSNLVALCLKLATALI